MTGKSVRKEDSQTVWNLNEVREILDLVNAQGISEFEMENNGFRIRIRRGPEPSAPAATQSAAEAPHFGAVHPIQHAAHPPQPQPAPAPRVSESTSTADDGAGLHVIKSPVVGTFYSSPGPDAPPFVKVGDAVQPGAVLCIIEAMKLMNEIQAEVAGEISKIYVENGQPVEYGQALFGLIPPA